MPTNPEFDTEAILNELVVYAKQKKEKY